MSETNLNQNHYQTPIAIGDYVKEKIKVNDLNEVDYLVQEIKGDILLCVNEEIGFVDFPLRSLHTESVYKVIPKHQIINNAVDLLHNYIHEHPDQDFYRIDILGQNANYEVAIKKDNEVWILLEAEYKLKP